MTEFGSAVPGENREAYGGVVSSVPVPIGVVTDDGVAYCNDAAVSFFEASDREALVGRPFESLIHRGDRRTVRDRLDHAVTDREAVDGLSVRVRTREESVREADLSLSPLPDDEAVVATVQPTSGVQGESGDQDRRRAAGFTHLVRQLLDALNDPVFVVDDSDRVVFANELLAETTGYARAELVGHTPETFLGTGSDRSAWQALDRTARDRTELCLHTDAGERIPHELSTAPLSDAVSGERYRVAVAHDVSDRKQRARKLERQNERLEEFARMVSHDLRNPLEVARTKLATLDVDQETVAEVDDALERMNDLIADVLALAREGQVVDETEVVSLASVATQCWSTVATGEADLDVADVWIRADRGQFRNLLENLFRNSIEHAGEDVTVSVGPVRDDGDRVGFYVADDGPGIDPDLRDRIFDSGVSTDADGTGFGLVIVDQIARAHGWSITVTSGETGSEEAGARFEFTGVETVDPGLRGD